MNSNLDKIFSLKNDCAVVIGGKGKIGLPISEALAEAGATVYIVSPGSSDNMMEVQNLRKKGLKVYGKPLDQSNEAEIKSLIEDIENECKTPNILVNSGVFRPMKKYLDDDSDAWDKSMEINAKGLFLSCKIFAKKMKENGGGSIINISSIYGIVAPDKSIYEGTDMNTEPDYPYNKGGMIMFSKYMASYFAEFGVRINCVAPGGIFNNQEQSFVDKYIQKVPMRRMGEPDDMKGVAVFLASGASKYITGTVIPVDGGLTII
ncbi:MAG: short-chain dehydrogenase [Bacteroidetes bacterium]|nr:MAG: short-chain dehydrogenase [Bacteroidota bacterium]